MEEDKENLTEKSENTEDIIEKEDQEMIEKNSGEQDNVKIKSKKIKILIIVATIIICFLILFSVIFALININNDKILSGITIMGVDASNMTQEEITKKIEDVVESKIVEDITLKYEDYETTINGKQFNVKYDVEKAVNEAYNIGRDGNIIKNNYQILLTRHFQKKY